MAAFSERISVNTSPLRVWEALADLAGIAAWNKGVTAVRLVTDSAGGIGAARHCDLVGGKFVREEVIEWTPLERLTLRVTDTDLPLARADIQFTIKAGRDGTQVRVRPDYDVKYGLFGKLLDALVVRRQYGEGMRTLLRGLKNHCEQDPRA